MAGWTARRGALVRVANGPAQVLVTVYQSPAPAPETAPRLQVLRSERRSGGDGRGAAPTRRPAAAAAAAAERRYRGACPAHRRCAGQDRRLDRHARQRPVDRGLSPGPRDGIAPDDVEYQAVLGRGWLSPWIEGGKFCGSRGMALPLLGLKVRLKGARGEDL